MWKTKKIASAAVDLRNRCRRLTYLLRKDVDR